MIELLESMEELIYQKKSNWTIKYVVEYSYHIKETQPLALAKSLGSH